MRKQFSQLELIQALKLPPTTVKRWLDYFSIFIPTIKIGDSVLYEFETLTLMKRIKMLRLERYHLSTIVRLLLEEGFPIYNKEEAAKEEAAPSRNLSKKSKRLARTETEEERPEGEKGEESPQQLIAESLRSMSEQFIRIAEQIERLSSGTGNR